MERLELARTIEARLEADADLAKTLVQKPRETIRPPLPTSTTGMHAIETLRRLGATLGGKIELHDTLGQGGMGVVHLATQATMGRHVAVKTLREGVDDEHATLGVLQEAWITGALEHPNVVPIYDVGVDANGSPIILMKRISGSSWADLIHDHDRIRERFSTNDPLEWSLRIFLSVCNAVHFAHSRGILHRDLKPENVMIGSFGEVYVVDWGIAVAMERDPSGRLPHVLSANAVAGTPCYMAPEMMIGDASMIGPWTDVYLLGGILYEIFAGQPPHEGTNLHAIVASVMLSEPKFPERFPLEARQICERAMRRDPEARYPSAEELSRAVEDYLRHRGSRRLAHEAKASLDRLLHVLASEPAGEDRTLAVFNLLGECRFGYRSALNAWSGNEIARKGLDRALLAVIELQLAENEPQAASSLLREVSAPPADLSLRVERALTERSAEEQRLRRMALDNDASIGSRTRSFLVAVVGTVWTLLPLSGWLAVRAGKYTPSPTHSVLWSLCFLVLVGSLILWARETISKTALNRRVAASMILNLVFQLAWTIGAVALKLSSHVSLLGIVYTWTMTEGLLAIWIDRWFLLPAIASLASIALAIAFPPCTLLLMSMNGLIVTLVLVLAWFPRQDIERIKEARLALRSHARRWLVENVRAGAPSSSDASSRRQG